MSCTQIVLNLISAEEERIQEACDEIDQLMLEIEEHRDADDTEIEKMMKIDEADWK